MRCGCLLEQGATALICDDVLIQRADDGVLLEQSLDTCRKDIGVMFDMMNLVYNEGRWRISTTKLHGDNQMRVQI